MTKEFHHVQHAHQGRCRKPHRRRRSVHRLPVRRPRQPAQSASQQLAPGAQICAEQYAGYQVRVDGTSKKPLHFRVFRNGVAIQSYPGSTGFVSELRSAWGTFPGAGYYKVCAVNNTSVPTLASVSIRTDFEI